MNALYDEIERLKALNRELYEALKLSKGRITHTDDCNVYAFRGMTGLAIKTMEDCGYNNDCDCGLIAYIKKRDKVLADYETKENK
jgi:hypothetical protein